MSRSSQLPPRPFRRARAAPRWPRPYRPVLEFLDDRCLLSNGFAQVNLASDVPGLARVTDPNLVNPWGAAFSPTGPFWFADNGSGVSDLRDGRGQPVPLVVAVPGAASLGGEPTGTVFNGGAGFVVSAHGVFAPSTFLFAGEDGTISGWSAVVDPSHAVLVVDNTSTGADYTGLALATNSAGHTFLYAADFSRGTIDVFDQDFRPVMRPGAFQDPKLPAGFAPFNIQDIGGRLFVTYAQRDQASGDNVPGAGYGFIDAYDTDGKLVRRFAAQGPLNSPWGLALAPASFGRFGGALLVGNNGDGRIDAYNLRTGAFLGQVATGESVPITIPDLWTLTFGNGHAGGDSDTLFFTAGVDYETHGLFGAIQGPGRHGAGTAGLGGFDPNAPGESKNYPLPPGNGPALRASSDDLLLPSADLLPLSEASLALVPTLSAVSQPGAKSEAPVRAAPGLGGSLGGAVSTPVSASGAGALIPGAGNSQSPQGDVISLNMLLDVSTSAEMPRKTASVQTPGLGRQVIGAANLPAADQDTGAAASLSGASLGEMSDVTASGVQSAATLPPGQADQGVAENRRQSHDESAEAGASGEYRAATQDGGGWRSTVRLFVVSIPVILAYWPRTIASAPRPELRP